MTHPWNANPIADIQIAHSRTECVDSANDLVPRDDRQLWVRQLAIHHMQVCPTNPARPHLDADLSRSGLSVRQLCPFERAVKSLQEHGVHVTSGRIDVR
jgi:hypothetical protein